jgi:hypothetical protein
VVDMEFIILLRVCIKFSMPLILLNLGCVFMWDWVGGVVFFLKHKRKVGENNFSTNL